MRESSLTQTGSIVRCLDEITRHRDIPLLNVSVMNSLANLLGLERIRLYDVIERNDNLFVALSAWDESGKILYFEDPPSEDQLEKIERHAEMAACLRGARSDENAPKDSGNIFCVPVTLDGQRPIAVFLMQRATLVTEHELYLANGIIAVYRNYLSLLRDSQHDTLTGLLNRKTFDHGVADLLPAQARADAHASFAGNARSAHQADTHWFAMIDIDHFKRINDQYGHIFGDEVLILLANLMRKSFRNRDRLYRFGGEEFVVLMRNIDFNNALQKLEAFRMAIANHKFPQVGEVTVTIGFAQVQAADTPEIVVGNADEALYYGKAHGRNQVNCYNTLFEEGRLVPKKYHTEAEFF